MTESDLLQDSSWRQLGKLCLRESLEVGGLMPRFQESGGALSRLGWFGHPQE